MIHNVNVSVLVKLCCISVIHSSYILSIIFMNFICKLQFNIKTVKKTKIGYISTINRNIKKQANVVCIDTYPRFPPFYYILGANLGSLLHGDVSVMI